MISVIIPTLNEEEHIESVIKFAFNQPNVSEVIVVDDKSLDNTVPIARASGARVVTSTKRIAMLLKDKPMNELIHIADQIPVVPNTTEIVAELRQSGYITGIISDSYDIITNHIRIKLGMDFSLSNELEFSQGICTGEVKIPSFLFNHPQSICKHTLCKTNAMLSVLNQYNIKKANAIAIGDSLNDLCMIRNAGMGVAFCSSSELVNQSADMIISEPSFSGLLNIAL